MATEINYINYKNKQIPVIFQKNNNLPIFNLQLVFKNSGYINDLKLSGLTNISAKILNEGTLKDGAIEFSKKLENKAIEIYASAGFETFVIEVSCLIDQQKDALKYLKQILKDPNISQKTLDKIKKLQVSKLAQKQNDYDYIASKQLKSIIYKNTSLQNSSLGEEEDINKITLDDVKKNINSMLNINNLIVVGGGDIKYTNFINKLEPLFKHFNDKKTKQIKKINIVKNTKSLTIKKDTQQSYIYFASDFNIEESSKDNYKAKLLSFILGQSGFGSRLMEEIRVKHGLAYSVYAYVTNKKSHSYFSGYLQTKLENTKKAKDMVENIINDFVKNGATKEELDSAKKFILGSEPLKTETFSQKLNRAFSLYYKNLPFSYIEQELNNINNISLEELNSYIKEHQEIKNLTFSILTK